VKDHRGRGGEEFIYRVEVERPRASLALGLDRVDIRRPQFLQAICVPRGGRFAAMVKVERKDAGGEVVLAAPTLPAGVTMITPNIPTELGAAPVLFEASADAALSGRLCELTGRMGELSGTFTQAMPLVVSAPNETTYYQTRVDRLAVAVVEASAFRVRLTQPTSPMLRQGGKGIEVVVERDAGFASDVTVHMLWNPPGVSSAGSLTIPGSADRGTYVLNASGDAPLKTWKVCVLARATVQGGDVWISSGFVDLTVADTVFSGAIQLGAVEQAKPALLVCKLTPTRAYEGKGKLTLLGLPPNTTCAPLEVEASATECVFEVQTRVDTPVGQHKGLQCEFELVQGTESITHRFAFGGVLRVDAPPAPPSKPAPVAVAPPAPPPIAAPPAPAKPLSRLDQLRKDAKGKAPAKPEGSK
jgi:hypothetical protein